MAIALFVFALITAAKDEDAVATTLLVLAFTDAVPALIALPRDDEAVLTSP